jgi:hypothetical protein
LKKPTSRPLRRRQSARNIRALNRDILKYPEAHPARRFLEALIACRNACVGLEIACRGSRQKPIDQQWVSKIDGKKWAFSKFAYAYLAVDLVLDGWLSNSLEMTPSESGALQQLPVLHRLLQECHDAACRDSNNQITELTAGVRNMLDLWEECIRSRRRQKVKATTQRMPTKLGSGRSRHVTRAKAGTKHLSMPELLRYAASHRPPQSWYDDDTDPTKPAEPKRRGHQRDR